MRRFTSICLTLAVLTACLVPGADLWAQGGRGGFKGGGGGGFKGNTSFRGKGGSKSGSSSIDRGNRKLTFSRPLNRNSTTGYSSRGDQPWSKHQARERFKLDQRQQVADHLREISDRNGNEQLKQVADDMDLRAQSHYDNQMDKIRQKYGLDDTAADAGNALDNVAAGDALVDPSEVLNGNDAALDDVARKLTGRENALSRQIHNEQRKLAKRTETVDRMRQVAGQTGDDGMLQAADRLDEWSMNQFDQRMAQITDFQQRLDLSDAGQYLSP
jgi:hypothetical protein